MGRGGEDGEKLLYGKWRVKRPDRPGPTAPGICGDLEMAGVQKVSQTFQIFDDSGYIDTTMQSPSGRPIENTDLREKIDDYLEESLRAGYHEFLEEGFTGTATIDVKTGKISVDLYEAFTSDEPYPWKAEPSTEVQAEIKRIGATSAKASIHGYGDSGDVESVDFTFPEGSDQPSGAERQKAERAISDFIHNQLEIHVPGWENNSGGFGTVYIEPGKEVDFDFTYRVDDSRLHRVEVDPKSGKCQTVETPES